MKTPDGEALVPLPPKTVLVERLELSGPEREVYQHLFANARRSFAANVDAGTLMKSYTTIFAHILRLRQSCCHPLLTRNKTILAEEEAAEEAADIAKGLGDDMDLSALLERFSADEGEQDASKFGSHVLRQIQEEEGTECPICSEEPMVEQAVTGCWHSACKKCLMDYIEHQIAKGELPRCFNCREPINARDVFEVIREDEEMDDVQAGSALTAAIDLDDGEDGDSGDELYTSTQRPADSNKAAKLNIAPTTTTTRISLRRVNQLSSIKISALLTALKKLRKTDSLTKSVVFSQFTSFLDLIGPALTAARIPTLRFDGSMSQRERARVLTDFANRTGFTVLLLSLRAGGVGLNLTCAKRVRCCRVFVCQGAPADRSAAGVYARPMVVIRGGSPSHRPGPQDGADGGSGGGAVHHRGVYRGENAEDPRAEEVHVSFLCFLPVLYSCWWVRGWVEMVFLLTGSGLVRVRSA